MPTNQLQAAWPLKKPQQLVYVDLGPNNGGMMLGICEQGLSYRAVTPLIADGPVNFAFALDGKTRLQGTGEIVWSEDGGKTGGLKFTNISPQFRESLHAWLANEAAPQSAGREVTPAVAMPLDSIEKIKQSVRENRVSIPAPSQKREEPKKQFKPRNWDTPPSEPSSAAKLVQPDEPATKPAEKSAANFVLHRAEPKATEQSRQDSGVSLPKLRLPFAPVPAAPVAPPETVSAESSAESVSPVPPSEPAPPVVSNLSEEPMAAVAESSPQSAAQLPSDDDVATALAAPGLPGLHEPHDFFSVEPSREEEFAREFESPRLNRAAATAIIALALAIIFAALVLSFRREVGEAVIHFGQMLAGEKAASPVTHPSSASAPTAAEDDSYPPAAVALRPALSQPRPDAPSKPASNNGNNTIRQISDPPATGGGSGQRDFEQARNILKGNHRQRDLPNAVNLLWTAVEKGSVSAEVTLADLYARGDGVGKSCDQARVLLEAATRKGSPEARRRLDQLKRQSCP
ncbi:MAG: hypothetical protein JSS69_16570 [Acidobacteria bacterium]|nr:hypothetical protein [Acidobacteriota bacterium]MBS1867530.1 hypothetical protein [Acidobacteriota bacterium]